MQHKSPLRHKPSQQVRRAKSLVLKQPAGKRAQGVGQEGQGACVDFEADSALAGETERVTDETEARDVGRRVRLVIR